jgi:putative hydrolase of the HAD superfamily
MHLHAVKIIVLDLDDTLYPEQQFVAGGFRAASSYLLQHGIARAELFPALWDRFCQGARGTIFDDVLKAAGIVPDQGLIQELVAVYRSHSPLIALYPDADALLCQAFGQKRLGLLTDGPALVQKNKVQALDIEPLFDIIVYTDALGREFWKPHPAGYKTVMDQLGLAGPECLYVGDNPAKDFAGARSLAWHTAHIRRGAGIYGEAAGIPADIAVDDLGQLAALLGMA